MNDDKKHDGSFEYDETDLAQLDESASGYPTEQKYYVYGSGMIGCLYDYGPNFCTDKEDAISSFLQLFGESLEPGEMEEMKINLHMEGYHRFWKPVIAGAHYCEISEEFGEMPVDS